jgi:hypothetical protein
VTDDTRSLLILLRAALIQAIGAIEDALGLPRSIASRRERERAQR